MLMFDRFLRGAAMASAGLVWFLSLVLVAGCRPAATPSSSSLQPASPATQPQPQPKPGNAPDFDSVALDGSEVKLSALRGDVVLLSFWASWCQPCLAEIPAETSLSARFQDKPFRLIGISLDDSPTSAERVCRRLGVTWPIVQKDHETIARQYHVTSIPDYVLIDRHGNLAGRWQGTARTRSRQSPKRSRRC